ncbi:hypothetical protein AHAS_Ahas01G0049600 [Arachis hypogaea]|nr:probable potassium transporter 17 [Arachis hypogaea]
MTITEVLALLLAYRSLGVVFGGLVTSPLYVYPSMPLNSPTEDDYLGIYSIMFWTLTFIVLVKYATIAIHADDHGEERGVEAQTWLAKLFERSIVALRVLLFLAMLGTCMIIGDGILTLAISVLSLMDGLRAPFPSVSKSLVEALSASYTIILVFSRLYLLIIFSISFGEMEKLAGFYLVVLSSALQERWSEMFPSMISRAVTLDVIASAETSKNKAP